MTVIIACYLFPAKAAAKDSCEGIKPGQKILWEGMQMVPGEIGKLTIFQDTPLYSFIDGEAIEGRIVTKGNTYRIYSFKSDYYGVGAGYYVKSDAKVTYKTPTKQKLLDVKCASPSTNSGDIEEPTIPAIQPVNLGPQVYNFSTIASKAGMDNSGNAYLYTVLHGTPTALAVVDLNTNQVKDIFKLESSTSAWALDVDNDGILWIGGTNNTNLYRYDPNTNQLKDYGNTMVNKSDTSIQDLVVTDNYVYGSSAYGADVFAFNKKAGKTEYILPMKNGKYAKSLAVDPNDKNLYVSSGPSADLFHLDLTSKLKTSILSDNYRDDSYIEKMKLIDDLLVVKFYPSKRGNIYSASSGTFLNEFMVDSRGFSQKDNQMNEFYYTYQGSFYGYNLENGTIRKTNTTLPDDNNALSLDFVQLRDNPSQNILTGLIDNDGDYYLYNPVTNELKIKTVTLPAQPVDLYLLFSDPDKRYIFANGYMTGGLTRYDTVSKTSIQYSGVNQLESALFLNDKLYTGVYPKAKLVEVSPNVSWERTNSKELLSLSQFGQDRITALTNNSNHLFAGTYPQYTTKGGLLLDYNLSNGQYQVYEDYVSGQSIITLLQDGPFIYGGTSIFANYKKTVYGAMLFRFDPQNPSEKELINLPVKASMVMSLIKGPDGNIWGAADGTIFSYNPELNTFRTVKLVKAISGNFSNAKLLVGKDGYIFGTIEGHLFKINPADMSYQILLESGAYEIAEDINGTIYYRNKASLYQYPVVK
jgi:streptogramin lyase